MSTTTLSTFPVLREQARHALLLLGAPAPARLVVDVHTALFDGDLSVPGLAEVLRDEERQYDPDVLRAYRICPALHHDLTVARGQIALSCWPVERRLVSPASARVNALADLTAEAVAEAVLRRWERLDERQRLFGVTSLPHQRARA